MKTLEELAIGLEKMEAGTTLKISGLVSSDDTVADITVTLLPPDGYRDMQIADLATLMAVIGGGELQPSELLAAESLFDSLRKSLTQSRDESTPTRGPQYTRKEDSPLHRLAASPDALYLLRMRREGPIGGKPPKGALPLAKFELTRKLGLQTGSYVHAVKLQDGRFLSVEIV